MTQKALKFYMCINHVYYLPDVKVTATGLVRCTCIACSHTHICGCRRPIAIPIFMQHFWWCFNGLKEYSDAHPGMPAYFRFMTILGEANVYLPEIISPLNRGTLCMLRPNHGVPEPTAWK